MFYVLKWDLSWQKAGIKWKIRQRSSYLYEVLVTYETETAAVILLESVKPMPKIGINLQLELDWSHVPPSKEVAFSTGGILRSIEQSSPP